MMTTSQPYGGKISAAFASPRKRCSMANKKVGSNSIKHLCRCSSFSWAIRKSCYDISGRCYLSVDRKRLFPEAVICCSKPFQDVPCCLVSLSSSKLCDVEEEPHDLKLDIADDRNLEKDEKINGLSESVFQPSSQPPSQNVRRELIMLSLPAVASQTIDFLAQLIETAYIGRLGHVELASAGVSMAIFNIVSKLFNMPLLGVSTSFVAEDIAKSSLGGHEFERKKLSSVSTTLLLAVSIGTFEALTLLLGTGSFLSLMGVSPDSPMRVPAARILFFRALGAPAVVLSLAIQGVLRGFKDTKTPVFCLGAANLSTIFMFPLLITYFQMGITGAATATVVSQYIGSFLMVWQLSKKVVLLPPYKLGDLKFGAYLKSGGFLVGRTMAILITMTIGTSMAAREGPLAMAAHQICKQVWLAVSLLTDALATSSQALIASYYSRGDYDTMKELTNFVLKIGLVIGAILALILGPSFGSLAKLFTKDYVVLEIIKSGTLFVSASQPLNSLAFIFDGLHYGVSDFHYAAYSMMLVAAISCVVQLYASSAIGLPGVWLGLSLYMGLRMAAGFFRIMSRNSPWWFLHRDSGQLIVGFCKLHSN